MTAKRTRVRKTGKTKKARKKGGATTSGATTTLEQFLASTGTLTAAQRGKIVDQAEVMLEALYVHLPLKRSMHATDPVQRLKLLRFHLANGLVSILSNLALMRLFTGGMGIGPVPANLAAISITSLANFLLGDRWVFLPDRGGRARESLNRGSERSL